MTSQDSQTHPNFLTLHRGLLQAWTQHPKPARGPFSFFSYRAPVLPQSSALFVITNGEDLERFLGPVRSRPWSLKRGSCEPAQLVRWWECSGTGLRVCASTAPGWTGHLAMAHAGEISVVRVTHEDRLARFGSAWLLPLLEQDGVLLEVAHPKGSAGGQQELLEDFTTLVATFAGRMYGIRSKKARRRLLVQAQQTVLGDDRSSG
ncbi:MAG: IS607 family transposase [Candidatus Dormibacteria bacterium]